MASVYDRVKKVVVARLVVDEAKVVPAASFLDDLDADSLDLVELIMALEEEFGSEDEPLEISDEEAENLRTLNDVIGFLESKGIAD